MEIHELYADSINSATEAANKITDPVKKSTAFVLIANALAKTGLIKPNGQGTVSTSDKLTSEEPAHKTMPPTASEPSQITDEKEQPAPAAQPAPKGRESLINKPQPEQTAPDASAIMAKLKGQSTEEMSATPTESVPNDIWNPDTTKHYREEILYINKIKKKKGESYVLNLLQEFFQSKKVTLKDVKPSTIKGIVAFFKMQNDSAKSA